MADDGPSDPDPQQPARRSRAVAAGFGLYLVAVGVLRYARLADRDAPATIDAGNWIAFGHSLIGQGTRSSEIAYPPLVPLLTFGATELLGAVRAVALVGAVASIAPALALFAVLHRRVRPTPLLAVPVAAACGLAAASASTGEATAWGGFPQLLGTAAAIVLLALVEALLEAPTTRRSAAAAATTLVILATSHFVATFAAVTIAGQILLAVAARPGERLAWLRGRLLHLVPVVGVAVLALPWYLPLLDAVSGGGGHLDLADRIGWGDLVPTLEFLYRDAPSLWRALLFAGLLVPVALRHRWRGPLWRAGVAAIVAVALSTAISREGRYLYFLPLAIVPLLALWIEELATLRRPDDEARLRRHRIATAATAAAALVALGVQTVTGLGYFQVQRDYYGIVTPATWEAFDHLDRRLPPDAVLAVSTVDDAPLGWWVEARLRRPTYYASPLRWLAYDDELRRARIANAIFSPPFPSADGVALARASGIEVLLVPTSSNRYAGEPIATFAETHPDITVEVRGDLVVVWLFDPPPP